MNLYDKTNIQFCRELNTLQSMAVFKQLQIIKENFYFIREFLLVSNGALKDMESCIIPGLYNFIEINMDALHKAQLLLCPKVDEVEAQEVQKNIEIYGI